MKKIMLGAGCFWGVEDYFAKVPGVSAAPCGYSGGHSSNPSYEDVCTDETGHAEVVEISFDESTLSLEKLLEHFFNMHDPTQGMKQGPDVGSQYRSAIYWYDPLDGERVRDFVEKLKQKNTHTKTITTELAPATVFYRAEEYHQQYFAKRGGVGHCHQH